MTCPHLNGNTCRVASHMAGVAVAATAGACAACDKHQFPRAANLVTASLAIGHVRRAEPDRYGSVLAKWKHLLTRRPGDGMPRPGDCLKYTLELAGETERPGCQCQSRVEQMNAMGCEECRSKLREIVTWLHEEAAVRQLSFWRPGAVAIVRAAIAMAESGNVTGPAGALAWCESHVAQILAWIKEESALLRLPFATSIASHTVRTRLADARRRLANADLHEAAATIR